MNLSTTNLRSRIDAALQAYAACGDHAEGVSGDCAAHREGLLCCIDKDQERYQQLLDFLVAHMIATEPPK